MNICITRRCNNDCNFCFQHNNIDNREMSVEDVQKIANWCAKEREGLKNVKILGGEPTIAKNFMEILDFTYFKWEHVTIISNLLCNQKITESITEYSNVAILANITHNDEKNQSFENNLDLLRNKDISISLAITLDGIHDVKRIRYLLNLVEKFSPEHIRIGNATPNYKYEIFTNNTFEENVKLIIKDVFKVNPRIHLGFDCSLNYCLLSEDFIKKILPDDRRDVSKFANFHLNCFAPPLDIYPDFSSSWCSSFNNPYDPLYIKDIFEYESPKELLEEFQKKIILFKIKNKPACDYKNCTHKQCFGLCPGITYIQKNQKKLIEKRFHTQEGNK